MSRLSDEDRATLVAYLDGELDENASQALEAKLSRDPQMRAEAEALKKTWELLDYLPRPLPSASFTHRTLERLAVTQTRPSAIGWRGWTWVGPLAWVAAMLIAVVGGLFAAHQLWTPAQPVQVGPPPGAKTTAQEQDIQNTMASDLEMLKSLQYYNHVDDVELLRQLNHQELFGDEEPGS
jgi:anti-sigma factor RsiW